MTGSRRRHTPTRLAAFALAMLAAACAETPVLPDAARPDPSFLAERANRLAEAGRPAAAATLRRQASLAAAPPRLKMATDEDATPF